MTVYLCTSGTSAAKLQQGFSRDWVLSCGGVESAAGRLLDTFIHYRMDSDSDLRSNLSAEIHSLARMSLNESDRVCLFSSETEDGQACAEAVAMYLQEHLRGLHVSTVMVEGLQVDDEQRFRAVGVVEYVKTVLKYIENYSAGQCILNPTGGFKALVPYTALVGMIKQVQIKYIFERSSNLITLPALPLEFRRAQIESIRVLLEEIDRESAVSVERFESILSWENRRELSPLFEVSKEGVTLSAIGFLVFSELNRPSALTPFLSREALKGFVKLDQYSACDPERYLLRVSRNPDALQQDKHGNAGAGLFWLKPGNTTDRYLVSEEGWRLLVWRIVEHSEYEKLSDNSCLGKQVRSERKSKYAPFLRMELTD